MPLRPLPRKFRPGDLVGEFDPVRGSYVWMITACCEKLTWVYLWNSEGTFKADVYTGEDSGPDKYIKWHKNAFYLGNIQDGVDWLKLLEEESK